MVTDGEKSCCLCAILCFYYMFPLVEDVGRRKEPLSCKMLVGLSLDNGFEKIHIPHEFLLFEGVYDLHWSVILSLSCLSRQTNWFLS